MSTISGLVGSYSSTSSFASSILGTSSSSSTSGSSLIDYAMIKNGAYGKLMSAYYSEQASESSKDQKTSLTLTKSSAEDLASSTASLMKSDFSEDKRDSLVESLKSWAEDYNELIESSDDIDDTSTLRQVLWMTQLTDSNSGLLSSVGINVDSDNKISIDEEKLKSADLTTLKDIFDRTDNYSYGSQLVTKAAAAYSASSSSLSNISSGSAYTSSGKYSSTLDYSSLFNSVT